MASPTLRSVKGTALTFTELDDNFSDINNELIDSASYDSATSNLALGRIGVGNLNVDFGPLTDALPDSLTFNALTNVISMGRIGKADISVNISDILNFDSAVTMNNTLRVKEAFRSDKRTLQTTATGLTMTTGVFYHVTDSSQTMTLPGGVISAETCELSVRDFDTTVVGRNNNKIMGRDSDMIVDQPYSTVTFTFIDSAYGWHINI